MLCQESRAADPRFFMSDGTYRNTVGAEGLAIQVFPLASDSGGAGSEQ